MRFLFYALLFLTACQERVSFTQDEITWLKNKGLYQQALSLNDEGRTRIKDVLATELSLIHDLDSLVTDVNNSIPDSIDIEITFTSPLSH